MNVYLFAGAVIAAIVGFALFFTGEKMVPVYWENNETVKVLIAVCGALIFAVAVSVIICGDNIPI